MIKIESIGMVDVAKNNPVLKSDKDVSNYSFMTSDGNLYLIANTLTGDDAFKEDVVIPAGEYLNGFIVKAWEGQKLVVDGKHISDDLSGVNVGDTLVVDDATGGLKKGAGKGVYFVVTDKGVTLTEAAVKVRVAVSE